jgi:hypothetical protein
MLGGLEAGPVAECMEMMILLLYRKICWAMEVVHDSLNASAESQSRGGRKSATLLAWFAWKVHVIVDMVIAHDK